jgi:hypothetical protein
MSQVVQYCYDFNTGQKTAYLDLNLQATSYAYNDPLGRLTNITYPAGGGSDNYAYGDAPPNPYVRLPSRSPAATPTSRSARSAASDGWFAPN